MFAILIGLLFWMGRNLAIYVQAWGTLAKVNQQNADSMQKMADTVYLLAKSQEKSKE